MAKVEKSIEEQYFERVTEGPGALLSEKGTLGKRFARFAFDGTYQPFGPYEASDESELRKVIVTLLAHAMSAYEEKFGTNDPAMLVETAKHTARGLHTHSGKYLQAESGSKFFCTAQEEPSPYLSSLSAQGMRSVTAGFAHAPKHSLPGKLYITNVLLNGKPTSVAELLVADSPVLRSEFLKLVTVAEYELIREHFVRVTSNESVVIDGYLPQMLWPTEDGDIALTAMPSLATYNSISAMHANVSEGAYLVRSSFMVGSGQAQNISVAASSVAGNLPLLKCLPPAVRTTSLSKYTTRAHSNGLAGRLKKEVVDQFFVDIHAWPNSSRKRFLQLAARRHLAAVFKGAWELRDAVQAEVLTIESLPESERPIVRFARGEPLTTAFAEELLVVVLNALPEDRKGRHSSEDWATYHDQVISTIIGWGN